MNKTLRKTLANLTGLSLRRIDQLIESEVIPPDCRTAAEGIQAYIAHLRKEASTTLAEARKRKIALEQRLLEIEIAEKEAELIPAREITELVQRGLLAMVQCVRGIAVLSEQDKRAIIEHLRQTGEAVVKRTQPGQAAELIPPKNTSDQ